MEDALVPEAARQMIGRQVGPGDPLRIETAEIERFCNVVGETNPVFYDDSVAATSVYGGRPMPLPYPLTNFKSGTERDFRVPLKANRRIRGGDELIVVRPVRAGDVLRAKTRLQDVVEKAGRTGRIVLLEYETEYLDQNGEAVMIVRTTIIMR